MKKSSLFASQCSSSDSETSSSELTDASDHGEERNVELVAQIYERANPRHALSRRDKSLGLSKRAVDRLAEALISARLALLRKKWTALQTALKQLDVATQAINTDKLLGYRLPIIGEI